MAMRKSFLTNEYCTVKQIRSLFSRWSKKVCNTSLTKLQDKLPSKLFDLFDLAVSTTIIITSKLLFTTF